MKRSKCTNSEDLEMWGFSEWHRLSFDNEEKLLKKLPLKTGIYAIKSDKPFGGFIENSDIVYIGSSREKKRGIRGRISQYFHPGPTQKTAKRINEKIIEYPNEFKISFLVKKVKKAKKVKKSNQVLSFENKLLTEYEEDHGELPPFNRNIGIRHN